MGVIFGYLDVIYSVIWVDFEKVFDFVGVEGDLGVDFSDFCVV